MNTTKNRPRRRDSKWAYETLRQRLVGGHYKPGTQLKEEPLANEFDISRTPIRTALKRLVEDGLATADLGQGIHVAQWSEWDLEETFQLRILLEPYAASLAAMRGGDELVTKLMESNEQMALGISGVGGMDSAVSVDLIQRANRTFHRALLEYSGSPRLRAILDTIIDMPIIVRSFYLYSPVECEQSLNHHKDLTLAIEARDGDLARRIMHIHLRIAHRRFMKHRDKY